jgi:hypothetical protein
MKIQCPCGAKYELNIVPEMATRPVRFVCSACGLDSSEFVNNLIRLELAQTAAPAPVSAAPPPPAQAAPAPAGVLLDSPSPARSAQPARVRVQVPGAAPAEAQPPAADGPPLCPKHPGEFATQKCFICSKPICPKCMEVFGYLCSPMCKAKADSHGIKVPVYELQRSRVEARQWRMVARVGTLAAIVLAGLFGFWIWWVAAGSRPKPIFSVRFPEPSYSGQTFICGKDQIVFLHGGTLARHDMKLKKAIWSRDLIDHKQIEAEAAKEMREMSDARARLQQENPEALFSARRMPTLEQVTSRLERAAAAELALHVRAGNVWVALPDKLVRYDWETGEPVKEIPYRPGYGGLVARGDELLLMDTGSGRPVLTHINLNSSECRTEEFGAPPTPASETAGGSALAGANTGTGAGSRAPSETELAGLPTGVPGRDAGKPMDPAKVAEQARHLPLAARIALPAVLAGTMSQERALTEMSDTSARPDSSSGARRDAGERVSIIPTSDGYVQVGVKVVESRIIEREAMKAPPAKSVLNGNLSVANSADAANEMLNQMQRERGGDKATEDVSRYQVSLRNPGSAEGWSGEVTGPPTLFPLQTVNVLAAGKKIIVFDKANKKLWESALNYNVSSDLSALDPENAPYGQGPCVEHKDALYVFDEGVLTAFDRATGSARWRLPSIGITGLFFDDSDKMYVNTTTAGLDSIKYSRQIDLSRNDTAVVLKIDCRTGKILWRAEPGGLVNYVSGKFVYVVSYYAVPEEETEEGPFASDGFSGKSYLRIRRLSPRNGSEIWLHFEQRAPFDVQFDKNTIRLVFKKEVEVLKFLTF